MEFNGAQVIAYFVLGRAFLGRSNRYVSNSAIISDVQAWLSLGLYCGEYAEESSY